SPTSSPSSPGNPTSSPSSPGNPAASHLAARCTTWHKTTAFQFELNGILMCFSFVSFTFTFSHLADAFIQSDLQCIHILYLHRWHTAHQEQLGVLCLTQGRFDRELN